MSKTIYISKAHEDCKTNIDFILNNKDWEDDSWHDDICASFINPKLKAKLYVMQEDPILRIDIGNCTNQNTPRYFLRYPSNVSSASWYDDNDPSSYYWFHEDVEGLYFETESQEELIKFISTLKEVA